MVLFFIMNNIFKCSEEDFKECIRKSLNFRQALINLKLKPAGGNYKIIKKKIKDLNIDISHFTGKLWLKGKTHDWSRKTPLVDILVNNSKYGGSGTALKKKLFKAGLFIKKCYKCNLTKWLNQPISLELEHINGNNSDNRIENLTLLCPNCHAQTDTYRRRKDSLKL